MTNERGSEMNPKTNLFHAPGVLRAPFPRGFPRISRLVRGSLTALVVTAAALGAAGCGEAPTPAQQAEAPPATVSVAVAVAELMELPVVAEASGSVEAWQRVSPGTKIMGRISELTVREGDRVSAGQLIARLESADLEAALAQARAAAVMAEATLENAATHHARMEQLHAQRSVTDKNLEDATAAHRVAAANVEVTRANVEAAEVMLSYAEVTAPISGWITAKMASAGDMAAPGRPLLVIEDLSRVKVRVNVPEGVVAGLAPGQSADVTILGNTRAATIDRIVPAGDPATRTFTVEMVLANADGDIKAGMYARAAFGTGSREAVLIPATAVVERGQLSGVFVVDEDARATLRWIKLGPRRDDRLEVLSGLQPGERYVTAPTAEVHDGASVVEGR
jgi:RND family efflux transporter MFP subunit